MDQSRKCDDGDLVAVTAEAGGRIYGHPLLGSSRHDSGEADQQHGNQARDKRQHLLLLGNLLSLHRVLTTGHSGAFQLFLRSELG